MNNEERVKVFASRVSYLFSDASDMGFSDTSKEQEELERLGVDVKKIQALFSNPRPGRGLSSFRWALFKISNELSKAKEPEPTEADKLKEVISTLEAQLDEAKTKLEEM